jgi:hypothetical protein
MRDVSHVFGLVLMLLVSAPLVVPQRNSVPASAMKSRRSRHALRHAHTRALIAATLARGQAVPADAAAAFDPPEQTIGERLFLETRYAQFFAANHDGIVNHPLQQSDPTVTYVRTTNPSDKVLGPFAGTSINCQPRAISAVSSHRPHGHDRKGPRLLSAHRSARANWQAA